MSKTKIEIIYADDDILVINKPSGVPVTKDRAGALQLTDILTEQLGPQICRQLRLIHRLDKETSGVMILAKNIEAQRMFATYFANRQVKKTYLALVSGALTERQGTIDTQLAHNHSKPALMSVTAKKGKEAVTVWKLLADFGSIALLAVTPLTGRTHQIRIHLAGIGLPLAIDPLYAGKRPLFLSDFKTSYRLGKGQTEKPLIERLTLHAYQIEFSQPQTNRPSFFIAPLDKKFAATLKMLTKHNPKGPAAFINPDDFSKILNGDAF
jgi:RluA family pseudouridine synthase